MKFNKTVNLNLKFSNPLDFMAHTEKHAYVILRVEDNEEVESIPIPASFKMISEADINKL